MTLNNLGSLQSKTNEMESASVSYEEALGIYRKLSESNPAAYLPDVAITLNHFGLLQSDMNELELAKASYEEALAIRKKLGESKG